MHAALLALSFAAWPEVLEPLPADQPFPLPVWEILQEPKDFAPLMLRAFDLIGEYHQRPSTPTQLTRWAVEGMYHTTGVPIPAAITRRLARLKEADRASRRLLLADVQRQLTDRPQLVGDRIVHVCIAAISVKLEPGACPGSRLEAFYRDSFCGRDGWRYSIGVKLARDRASGCLRVVTPIYNGPAHKAGIRGGDLVTHIRVTADEDGVQMTRSHPTNGMTVAEAEKLLLGPPHTKVQLTIIPAATVATHRDG